MLVHIKSFGNLVIGAESMLYLKFCPKHILIRSLISRFLKQIVQTFSSLSQKNNFQQFSIAVYQQLNKQNFNFSCSVFLVFKWLCSVFIKKLLLKQTFHWSINV